MPTRREKFPCSHHLLHFRVSLFDCWRLRLHRRLHLLGDAAVALLFARCQRGELRGEELLPWNPPSKAAGVAAAGTSIFPELLLLPGDPGPDRWDPGSAGSVAHCSATNTSGVNHRHCRAAQGTPHWMLRLRYCRNMLASWGRFSSLGCILV